MWFLYNNAAVLAVAAICCVFSWLYGGTVASALLPAIPWLFAILLEVMLCFPQRHSGETTFAARKRVWCALKRDPLTWLVVVFYILLLIPFVNKALCPCCDYPAINFDGARQSAPIPFLPYCVDRMEHLNVVLWFFPALLSMLAVKHSLLREGTRLVLEMVVWNGLALSAIGLIQHVMGADSPLWADGWGQKAYFFSTFGYPNMGGDYFTTLFALAVAAWRWRADEALYRTAVEGARHETGHRQFWARNVMLIPAVVFFLSAMMTLSRASIVLASFLALVFFVHTFISFLSRMSNIRRVKAIAVNFIAIIIIATSFYVFFAARESLMQTGGFRDEFNKEISTLSANAMLERAAGKGQYHVRVATQIWLDNILFGCGGWGYKHLCIPKMTDEEFDELQKIGGINVHNDFLQFLAEHGTVGFGLLAAMVVLLVAPIVRVWRKLVVAASFMKGKKRPPRPVAVFSLPSPVFCILAALVSTLFHSLADCPLRSPAVLTLFFVALAALDGFMPKLKNHD